ncbi:MAG: ammonia-forming cytochrome c nitrite reductase subunit c552 [Propionibacteriaceae bacterium]|nr:ammonia-forming cytochrome c nitrite reductase subunit c552 [Propionibacteriaceae bacterium]
MSDQNEVKRSGVPIWALAVIVIVAAGITFAITAIVANIGEKKGQSDTEFTLVVPLADQSFDPAVWGQNFPNQYNGWQATEKQKPKHYMAALIPHVSPEVEVLPDSWYPKWEDTRTQVTPSKIEEDPRLKTMWAGYAFAIDYRHLRGHQWMLIDQRSTLRVANPRTQPGACVNCHASTVEMMESLGGGTDEAAWQRGFEAFNPMHFGDATELVTDPIGCIDCHDPATMQLRISRPALINGLKAWKASQGITNYDVNKDATTQEMRSFVCAQCHVEYYFEATNKNVTFPWADGLDIDQAYGYYDDVRAETDFKGDFKSAKTGAMILKVQHPEFESWSTSVHALNGVSCADCHMAYNRVGAMKVSNHDVTTPMVNINGTCGQCHTASDQVIEERVRTIQHRFKLSRDVAFDSLVALIAAINEKQEEWGDDPTTTEIEGSNADILGAAMEMQRKASFYMDWAYSENSYGFHSPDYFQRICNQSLDFSRQGQLLLAGVPASQMAPSDISQTNRQKIEDSGLI